MRAFLAAVLLLLITGPTTAEVQGGRAEGRIVSGSSETALTHAYVVEVDSLLRIVLAAGAVEEIRADAGSTSLTPEISAVVIHLDKERKAEEAFFLHGELRGISVREISRFIPANSRRGTLAGRAVMSDSGFSFGFDATFESPVVPLEMQPMPAAADPVRDMSEAERDGALVLAVERGDVAAAKAMVDAGANVSQSDEYKQSLLMRAGSRPEMIALLAAAGADVNAANQWKMTPLMAVAEQGSLESVQVLVGAGANVNARNTSGMTALAVAVMRGHEAIVKSLLESGADVKRDLTELRGYAKDHPGIAAMIEAAAKR